MADLDWLSLEPGEEVLWSGNPKLQRLIGFTFTDFVVTDEGVYRKTGIFSKRVKKIGFEKIQNISFAQGFLGKIFGYGNVNISTAGSSGVEMMFRGVSDPDEVQDIIGRRIREKPSEEKKEDKEVLAQILEEVKEINRKLE